jgi:large subunit ribosomal protein L7/L12
MKMGDEGKKGAALSEKLEKLYESITALTVKEAADLVKAMEERLGISAAAPVAVAGAAAAGAAGGEAAVVEKTTFDIVMTASGDKKIQVIKEARRITGLGLKEAKDLVDKAPEAVIKKGVAKEEAEKIKAELEAAGATITLK